MKQTLKRFIPLVLILLLMAAAMIPEKIQERKFQTFGEPLFSHALPEGSKLISQDAGKDDSGGITAALLLQTSLTSQELELFYGDTAYPPAEEGQSVTLQAKALTESDLETLQKAELYEEDAEYQFVYLYSK